MRTIFKIAKTELREFILLPDCLVDFDYIHVSNRNVVFRNDLGDRAVAEYGRERDESDFGHIWRAKRIVCGSTVLSVFVYSFVDNGIDE